MAEDNTSPKHMETQTVVTNSTMTNTTPYMRTCDSQTLPHRHYGNILEGEIGFLNIEDNLPSNRENAGTQTSTVATPLVDEIHMGSQTNSHH